MELQPVILSGGSGTRLWPLSREQYPKQLLALVGDETMLQATAGRLAGFKGRLPVAQAPIVVCNEEYRFVTAEQLRSIGRASRNIVLEPIGRNTAPALTLGTDLGRGADAVVAGFPLDGPLRLDAARVRQVLDATGQDIYGQPGVTREIYSLLARVEPGNSGGPLLSSTGQVVGIVFAKSLDDDQTGYALTIAEAAPVLQAAAAAHGRVDTGGCSLG